jgi:hypothetical protein
VSAREELCTNKEAVIRQGGATEVSSQTHAQRIKHSCGAEPPPECWVALSPPAEADLVLWHFRT